MGEGAKKKRAAEARAARKAKAAAKAVQLVDSEAPANASTEPTTSDIPTGTRSKKTGTAPRVPSIPSRVQLESAPTRQSAPTGTRQSIPTGTRRSSRSLQVSSSSTLGSGKNDTPANSEGTNSGKKTRPQRSATAAAMALLQELQFSGTDEIERDPEGVFTGNDEIDRVMELDDEEDDDEGTSDSGDDGSDIEVIEESVARKDHSKVSATA